MAKKKQEEELDIIDSIAADFKKDCYGTRSGEEIKQQDIITTSSFWMDYTLGGGFRAGSWSRFYSDPELGKTSMALCWGRNWQDKYGDNARVIYFNAEGRVNRDLLERTGIDTGKDRFRIIDTNVYETIYDITERLIKESDSKVKYFFIVDSTDACLKKDDAIKGFGDSAKIAGGAAILSAAGKRLSLLFNCSGHHLFLCSQIRDTMATGPMAGKGVTKAPSGGHAPKFYSSLSGQIIKPWSGTYIYENPSDKKSNRIGVMTKIRLDKTPNESTGRVVEIPIQYGLKGGVWRAYEAMMIAQSWNIYKSGGTWWEVNEQWVPEMEKYEITVETKVQGEKKLRELFDSSPKLVEFCLEKGKIMAATEKTASKVSIGDAEGEDL